MAWCSPGAGPALSAHALCFLHCSHFSPCVWELQDSRLLHIIFPLLFANKHAASTSCHLQAHLCRWCGWNVLDCRQSLQHKPPPAPWQMQDCLANVAALPGAHRRGGGSPALLPPPPMTATLAGDRDT